MILHTSPNDAPPLWMCNGNRKPSIYQLSLLFNLDPPPQVINLLLIVTLLSNIHIMFLPNVINFDILLHIQVRISLFQYMFLQHIH